MLVTKSITLTTAIGGAATGYLGTTTKGGGLTGKLLQIYYEKDDFVNGVDFTITAEDTAEDLWVDTNINASEPVRPRIAVQKNTGADVTRDGTRKVYEPYLLVDERIEIVIAQGGDAKSGTFHALIEQ